MDNYFNICHILNVAGETRMSTPHQCHLKVLFQHQILSVPNTMCMYVFFQLRSLFFILSFSTIVVTAARFIVMSVRITRCHSPPQRSQSVSAMPAILYYYSATRPTSTHTNTHTHTHTHTYLLQSILLNPSNAEATFVQRIKTQRF